MDIMNIVMAAVSLGALGVVFAIILGIASKVFYVEVDERIPLVQEALPGANCGGCGYAGCAAFATAVVDGVAPVDGCPVGGSACAAAVAEVMGVTAAAGGRKTAYVKCSGTFENAVDRYKYDGLADCRAVVQLGANSKACNDACCGLGSCVAACVFDAIKIVDGVAVVDKHNCTSCGACVKACPKNIIEMIPFDAKVAVACSSKDKGAIVRNVCKVGCIACTICVKNCTNEMFSMKDNLAVIDYERGLDCDISVEKCPRKIIKKI